MVDPVAYANTTPLVDYNPLASAKQAVDLGNAASYGDLLKQNIVNAGIAGQQAQSNLNDSLNAQVGRASLAHAMYGVQTPQAYRDEIDRIVRINPQLASVANVWKQQITDETPPERLKQIAIQHASALLDPTTQTNLGPNGQVTFVNDGQNQIPLGIPGGLGRQLGAVPFRAGNDIQNQPSPSDLLTPQTVTITPEMAKQYNLPPSMIGTSFPVPRGQATPYRGTGAAPAPLPAAPMPNGLAAPVPGVQPSPRGNLSLPAFDPATGQPLGRAVPVPTGPVGAAPGYNPRGGGNLPPNTPQGAPLHVPGTPYEAPYQGGGLPPPPAQAQSSQLPFGALPSGMPSGAQTGIEQNQQAYRNAQNEAATLPLANTQYIEAMNAIRDIKDSDFSTGLGSGRANKVRQLLVQLGVAGPDVEKNVNSAVTAEKYLAAAIANKLPGSDARQDLLQHSNPSVAMPAGATIPIIRQIVASNRAKQATLATAPDQTGAGFLPHQEAKSKVLNSPEGLKALSWDLMTEREQKQTLSEIQAKGGDALNNFYDALRLAHKHKLLSGGQ